MTTNFDLRTEKVIPVQLLADPAEPTWVGLRDLFLNAHKYADLAVAVPPAAAGWLRVLYTIAARITGLDAADRRDEFEDRRIKVAEEERFTQVDNYLYRPELDNRWNLFDQHYPWLQDPRLATQAKQKTVNLLDLTRPRDHGPIWWRHTWDEHAPPLPTHEAVYWLLAYHWYGPGGGLGTRKVGAVSRHYAKAGPLRGTSSFYPLGRNLFETLIAGIPAPESTRGTAADRAAWELAEHPDPLSQPGVATWPAGILTGQSRHALLLVPDETGSRVVGCYGAWSYQKKHLPLRDPYTIEQRDSQGEWRPRKAQAARALWRDVDALLADRQESHRPRICVDTQTLPVSWQDAMRVRVHGWDQDALTRDYMMFSADTPRLLKWQEENDPEAAAGAAELHGAAEEICKEMVPRLRRAYRSVGNGTPGKPHMADQVWSRPAEVCYWSAAETLFWKLLRERRFDQPYHEFLPLALQAVDTVTRPMRHNLAVARESAGVIRALHRFAHKRNPRENKDADDQ